jgi:hypothetical protein
VRLSALSGQAVLGLIVGGQRWSSFAVGHHSTFQPSRTAPLSLILTRHIPSVSPHCRRHQTSLFQLSLASLASSTASPVPTLPGPTVVFVGSLVTPHYSRHSRHSCHYHHLRYPRHPCHFCRPRRRPRRRRKPRRRSLLGGATLPSSASSSFIRLITSLAILAILAILGAISAARRPSLTLFDPRSPRLSKRSLRSLSS